MIQNQYTPSQLGLTITNSFHTQLDNFSMFFGAEKPQMPELRNMNAKIYDYFQAAHKLAPECARKFVGNSSLDFWFSCFCEKIDALDDKGMTVLEACTKLLAIEDEDDFYDAVDLVNGFRLDILGEGDFGMNFINEVRKFSPTMEAVYQSIYGNDHDE